MLAVLWVRRHVRTNVLTDVRMQTLRTRKGLTNRMQLKSVSSDRNLLYVKRWYGFYQAHEVCRLAVFYLYKKVLNAFQSLKSYLYCLMQVMPRT